MTAFAMPMALLLALRLVLLVRHDLDYLGMVVCALVERGGRGRLRGRLAARPRPPWVGRLEILLVVARRRGASARRSHVGRLGGIFVSDPEDLVGDPDCVVCRSHPARLGFVFVGRFSLLTVINVLTKSKLGFVFVGYDSCFGRQSTKSWQLFVGQARPTKSKLRFVFVRARP